MGSSAKKKKEKKKDFQKPKLKVGKARPKAANFTDTSFKSKAIVVNQQSLDSGSNDPAEQFRHNLSLAATSKSDSQRRDSLAYLTTQLCSKPPNNPVGTPAVLAKLLPLTSDGSTPVRTQLLKLFRSLPVAEVKPHVEKILMYIRAGMTHLSAAIREDNLNSMEWVLDAVPDEAVSCPGGWVKTLSCIGVLLGWKAESANQGTAASGAGAGGWSSAPAAAPSTGKGGQSRIRLVQLLARFLEAGLKQDVPAQLGPRAYWDNLYRIPRTPNPFAYLNLFGAPRDEAGEMYTDRESRQRVFGKLWYETVGKGVESAKKEGGAVGRAAAGLDQVLREGMADYESPAEV